MKKQHGNDTSLGAKAGNLADRAVDKVADLFGRDDDDYYRAQHGSARPAYDEARSAYAFGHRAGVDPRYAGRSFDEVEADLRRDWEEGGASGGSSWAESRGFAQGAFARGQERRLVLSEEQLAVGKRQVQAGEVSLRKTVETRHVQESVPLVHEEVEIERRPLSAADVTDAQMQIGEETIRVPLMAEEVVVDKRVVPVEEVVVRKTARTEEQTVEADVRKERLVTEGLDQQRGLGGTSARSSAMAGTSGAADRATDSGPLDRLADTVDDLKDRVDGNPASKPGPDRTDRRI